jgi:hypothetical protein
MIVRILLVIITGLLFVGELEAKSWRGIVPLKSTRADVERLLGKPNSLGRYQFADERAYIFYREYSCNGAYLPLQEDNCECFVSKDTVTSIHVELEVVRRFSSLHLDKTKYERKPDNLGAFVDYSNWDEGVKYTVDESRDEITGIAYAPSAADCKELTARNLPTYRNSWRGLVPLHSTRTDVERLLGPPAKSNYGRYVYDTDYEHVNVRYSSGECKPGENDWNVPAAVVIDLTVNPIPTVLTRGLRLDPVRFRKEQGPGNAEVGLKQVNYTDEESAVIVRARDDGRAETVISITYSPSRKDNQLRCAAVKNAQ